jgi:L-seryl-tRNA(Ser) seleniumtransferase
MSARLALIGNRASALPGVTYEIRQPGSGMNNQAAGVTVRWDPVKLGLTGEDVVRILDTTDPRILVGGGRGAGNGVSISGFNFGPGDEKIVADRLYEVLSAKRTPKTPDPPKPPAADLSGLWDVHIEYAAGASRHSLTLQQQGGRVQGMHQGDFIARELTGSVNGDSVLLRSSLTEREVGNALTFTFSGKIAGDSMSGELDMGEYLKAKWSAKKHQFAHGAGDQG